MCAHELATARAEGDLGSRRLRRKEMDCDTGKVEEPDGYPRKIYRRNNNKTGSNQARVLLLCAVVYNEMSPSNAGVVYLRSPHQPRSSAPQFPGLSSLGKLQI